MQSFVFITYTKDNYDNSKINTHWKFRVKNVTWIYFSSVQLLRRVWLFATQWTTSCQVSLSITNSQGVPKFMSIESVMPSNHLILHHSLLLLPSVFPSTRVFSNKSVIRIRWPNPISYGLRVLFVANEGINTIFI